MGRLDFLHQHYVFLIAFIVMMSMEASAADEDKRASGILSCDNEFCWLMCCLYLNFPVDDQG